MNLKSNKAITLVALIITIIILLILAGVTLSMVLGDNGLINKAQSSVNRYQEAAREEQNLLENIDNFVADHMPPPAGTSVELLPGWDGSKVDAIADGKGNTIPVPKDFYYVGGNFNNGVVISDASADEYDGITDKTTWEYTTNLVGNQFVWIPCETEEYKKTSWGSLYVDGSYDTSGPTDEETNQITTYGGFFVGRYEAGLANSINEYTIEQPWDSTVYNTAGVPKSKAGAIPWNFISQPQSKINAESMYNKTAVKSGLITGTQWDVILKKFIGITNQNGITFTNDDMTNSSRWGNHRNNNITFTGRSATVNNGKISTWSEIRTETTKNKESNTLTFFSTGASKETEAYHTYDIAGNVWEWTEEAGQGVPVGRGGACNWESTKCPVCFRGTHRTTPIEWGIGFRIVLYIK